MKKIMSILAGALLCSCSSTAQKAETAEPQAETNAKILVAYYSATGTTEGVAKQIADATNATLYAITPETPYTDADLDWRDKESRSSVEMADDSSRPALSDDAIDAAEYDVVFLGFPNWWNLPPRIVNSWIESQNLAGKKVVLFMTSGGSSIDNSEKSLKNLYPEIDWQQGRLLNDTTGLAEWAKGIVGK